MHLFSGTENSVYWAGLYAFGAADALRFPNKGHFCRRLCAVIGVKGEGLCAQKLCQFNDSLFSARRTLINRFTQTDRLCIRTAARISTLSALGLREHGVDRVDQ